MGTHRGPDAVERRFEFHLGIVLRLTIGEPAEDHSWERLWRRLLGFAAFGGTTQLVVTWLIHVTGSAMAPAWYMLGAGALGQIALMLIAESAPVRLRLVPHR